MAILSVLAKQRRFKLLLIGLLVVGVLIGFIVVPVELQHPDANITSLYEGLWWSVATITSVGYGDVYPITPFGRLLGMILAVIGVLAFGLLTGMVTAAVFERRDSYYRKKTFQRLDDLEASLQRLEKQSTYVISENKQD